MSQFNTLGVVIVVQQHPVMDMLMSFDYCGNVFHVEQKTYNLIVIRHSNAKLDWRWLMIRKGY